MVLIRWDDFEDNFHNRGTHAAGRILHRDRQSLSDLATFGIIRIRNFIFKADLIVTAASIPLKERFDFRHMDQSTSWSAGLVSLSHRPDQ